VSKKYYREDDTLMTHSLDPTIVLLGQSKVFRPKPVDSIDFTGSHDG
jgi:hypothetical protein